MFPIFNDSIEGKDVARGGGGKDPKLTKERGKHEKKKI